MVKQKFYEALGNLAFAIAKADGVIEKKEIKALEEMVTNEIVPFEDGTDEFGTDIGFYVQFQFDTLEDSFIKEETAYKEFETFVNEHTEFMTPARKSMSLSLVKKVADSYRGINKQERAVIEKLEKLLY
ncbi:MAG: hypothetical protein EA412_03520 [Chitinophagaceae bacterium]|nr:MAG: hypothetical protein EA412_03520 [Chitinophagaceae bacterium]